MSSGVIWMDGELVPFASANVHVLSHSLHYGSAAFEGIRAYQTKSGKTAIFRALEHMQRFQRSVRALGAELKQTPEQLVEATTQTIRANGLRECYVRPISYIGAESRGLKLPTPAQVRVSIAVWEWGRYLGDSQTGIKVAVSSMRRPEIGSALPWAKLSGNYLNSILARREAAQGGYDEAILLDHQGYVAEGSGENIFVVQNGVLLTPPAGAILLGITRDTVFELARRAGLTVKEVQISRNQLYDADEAFFTGTAAEVTPIGAIDGRRLGDGEIGPITKRLSEAYTACIRGEMAELDGWLTYVN